MPNTNCLRGIRCPKCGQERRFKITGTSLFDVYDDGTEGFEDVEWTGDFCLCPDCQYEGKLSDFQGLTPHERSVMISEIFTRCMKDPAYLEEFITARTRDYGYEEYDAIFEAYVEEEHND